MQSSSKEKLFTELISQNSFEINIIYKFQVYFTEASTIIKIDLVDLPVFKACLLKPERF